MSTATLSPPLELNQPDFARRVAELRVTDNWSNWYYLAREYLFLALIVGGAIAFYEWLGPFGWHWLAAIPVTLVAHMCVGAGQHRLATLTHEAAHYMLFKNRLLNEFVSEWFCMYPILGKTHPYRVQHLGHHQFPNDPDRDPDWTQMAKSGHRYTFPMTRWAFWWHCILKQFLWLPNLLRYVLVRASFLVDEGEGSPYRMIRRTAKGLSIAAILYHVALVAALAYFLWQGNAALLAIVPAGMWLGMALVHICAPERWFADFAIKSDIPVRWLGLMRITFNTLLGSAIAWLTLLSGQPWWLYFFVLWMIPLGTWFSFFMILRQIVQHGNADQGRFTNTRVFLGNPLISMAVFPIGNDFHLPHHLFPMVPHYNLVKLHELLLQTEVYQREAIVVDGYFIPAERPPKHPTMLDLMTH